MFNSQESEVPKGMTPEKALTLDDIPNEHKFLKLKRLEEEGAKGFDIMLRFQASPHISRYIYFKIVFCDLIQ